MNKKLLLYRVIFILFIAISIIFSFSTFSYAAYPKLISKLLAAFDKIKGYLVAIATPAAAIAVASGFLMQKFSFGDEERIRNGKKLIRTSVIAYAFILTLDLIINLIQSLVG